MIGSGMVGKGIKMINRSLYQCFNARVITPEIVCGKGYSIGVDQATLNIQELAIGLPLEPTVCQECADYDKMGPPVKEKDRGW